MQQIHEGARLALINAHDMAQYSGRTAGGREIGWRGLLGERRATDRQEVRDGD